MENRIQVLLTIIHHLARKAGLSLGGALLLLHPFAAQSQIVFPPDVTISRVEAVQSAQDQDHTVPLIAGKATAVRAFIRQEGRPEAIVNNITAVLRGFRNGVELSLSPLRPINPAIPARLEPDRGNVNHSQNFILPSAWTETGKVELRAELRLPAGAVEAPSNNNTTSREVEFLPPVASEPRIAWLPLCVNARCALGGFQHQRLTERLFPFADGTLRYEDVPSPALNWPGGPDEDGLLAALEKRRLLLGESGAVPHVIVGWLPRGTPTASPINSIGSAIVLPEQADAASNELLLARALAGYSSTAENPCSAVTGDPGFDPVTARFMPASRLEFTSTCATATAWVSPAITRHLVSALDTFRGGSASAESRLIISGLIREDGTALLNPAIRLAATAPLTATNAGGESMIRVNSSTGTQEYRFFLRSRFAVSVPYTGTLTTVALVREGVELASLSGTGTAPDVSFLALSDSCEARCTLSWIAADSSQRALSYTVFYSANDGVTWIPLATDLTAPALAVDTNALSGTRVLFRVIAAAGLDQAAATSSAVTLVQAPRLDLPSTTFDFGSLTLGQIAEKGITVRNSGNAPLEFTSITPSKDAFQASTNVPLRVRPGTERALPLRYQPRNSGADSATVTLASNDPGAPSLAVDLKASVFDRPVANAVLSPQTVDFGEVAIGQLAEAFLTLRNDGTAPLNVTSSTVINARFGVVSPTGAYSLEAGEARTITLRFQPIATGLQTGSISVASNDPANPTLRAEIRGTGFVNTAPNLDLSPTSLDFGSVNINQSRTLPLNVRNAGNGSLTLSGLAISSTAFSIVTPATPVIVAPGQTQLVSVRFAPTATGPVTAALTVTSNDPNRPRVVVDLAGTGLVAVPPPAPQITSLIPASLVRGSLRFNLTVLGSGFTTASQVLWNGSPRPTVFVSPSQITGSIAPEDVAAAGTASVNVSTLGGGSSSSLPVVVSGSGHAARITDIRTDSCPTVIATMTVTDAIGNAVTALNSGNLFCTEDGVQVPCTANLAPTQNSELSAVMVLHASAGIQDPAKQLRDIFDMRRYAFTFIENMSPQDRLFITQMDNGVRALSREFTIGENQNALHDTVDSILVPRGVGTSLYDAIEDGIQRLASQTGRRKALVVFSGNENTYDTNGPRDLNAFFRMVQTSGVPVFFFPLGDGYQNVNFLNVANQIALDSGGELFRDDRLDVGLVIQRLSAVLHNQQFLNYNSSNRDGLSHLMRVTINIPGASFTTARSYTGCR